MSTNKPLFVLFSLLMASTIAVAAFFYNDWSKTREEFKGVDNVVRLILSEAEGFEEQVSNPKVIRAISIIDSMDMAIVNWSGGYEMGENHAVNSDSRNYSDMVLFEANFRAVLEYRLRDALTEIPASKQKDHFEIYVLPFWKNPWPGMSVTRLSAELAYTKLALIRLALNSQEDGPDLQEE